MSKIQNRRVQKAYNNPYLSKSNFTSLMDLIKAQRQKRIEQRNIENKQRELAELKRREEEAKKIQKLEEDRTKYNQGLDEVMEFRNGYGFSRGGRNERNTANEALYKQPNYMGNLNKTYTEDVMINLKPELDMTNLKPEDEVINLTDSIQSDPIQRDPVYSNELVISSTNSNGTDYDQGLDEVMGFRNDFGFSRGGRNERNTEIETYRKYYKNPSTKRLMKKGKMESFDPNWQFKQYNIYEIVTTDQKYAITADKETNEVYLSPPDPNNKAQWMLVDSDTKAISFFDIDGGYLDVNYKAGNKTVFTDTITNGRFTFDKNGKIGIENTSLYLAFKPNGGSKQDTTSNEPIPNEQDVGSLEPNPDQSSPESFRSRITRYVNREKYTPNELLSNGKYYTPLNMLSGPTPTTPIGWNLRQGIPPTPQTSSYPKGIDIMFNVPPTPQTVILHPYSERNEKFKIKFRKNKRNKERFEGPQLLAVNDKDLNDGYIYNWMFVKIMDLREELVKMQGLDNKLKSIQASDNSVASMMLEISNLEKQVEAQEALTKNVLGQYENNPIIRLFYKNNVYNYDETSKNNKEERVNNSTI